MFIEVFIVLGAITLAIMALFVGAYRGEEYYVIPTQPIQIGEKIMIRIKLDEGAKMPNRAHPTDAGLDLFSREEKVVPARGSAIFDTGVHVELPKGTTGLILPKSGLNCKRGILSFGVVDVGYTGSVVAKLYNHSDEDYLVHEGDKITQLVIVPILTPPIELVESLDETDRGDGGFGSTGR